MEPTPVETRVRFPPPPPVCDKRQARESSPAHSKAVRSSPGLTPLRERVRRTKALLGNPGSTVEGRVR